MSNATRCAVAMLAILLVGAGRLEAQKSLPKPVNPPVNAPALDAEVETIFMAGGRQYRTGGRYYRSKDGKTREDSPIGSTNGTYETYTTDGFHLSYKSHMSFATTSSRTFRETLALIGNSTLPYNLRNTQRFCA